MKRLSINIILVLITAMCFSSCSSSDEDKGLVKKQYQISGIASKMDGVMEEGGDLDTLANTRSIFFGGSTGTRFFIGWDTYDDVYVFRGGFNVGVLTPEEKMVSKTNLVGSLDGTFAVGDELQLYVPTNEWDFTDQTGDIASMSAHCFMSAMATVSDVDSENISVSDMKFMSQCMYYTYTPRDQEDLLIDIKKMTIHIDSGGEFVSFMDPVNNIVTYTNELVINCEKESKTNNYPTKAYVSLIYTGRPVCTYTIETGDGKIYVRANSSVLFGLKCTCINVDAGVSTGITPPSDEDVTIDDVTKE